MSEQSTDDTERFVLLDICCGLGGFSAAFEDSDRWGVFTVDIEEEFGPDVRADVLDLRPSDLLEAIGLARDDIAVLVVLASPPCTVFSKACPAEEYWKPETQQPDHPKTREHIALTHHIVGLIKAIGPDYWVLENPVGRMRWILGRPRGTVSYCQYGEDVMKPTDLWGEHPPGFEYRWCGYGDNCHAENTHGGCPNTEDPYPRDPAERAKVPYELSESVLEAVEGRAEQSTLVAATDGENTRALSTDTDHSTGGGAP
jgi:hypothetical protein